MAFTRVLVVMLTLAMTSLRGRLRGLTWAVWLAGASLTMCTIARSPLGIAISTGVLFALFCPWAVLLGRRLHASPVHQ